MQRNIFSEKMQQNIVPDKMQRNMYADKMQQNKDRWGGVDKLARLTVIWIRE